MQHFNPISSYNAEPGIINNQGNKILITDINQFSLITFLLSYLNILVLFPVILERNVRMLFVCSYSVLAVVLTNYVVGIWVHSLHKDFKFCNLLSLFLLLSISSGFMKTLCSNNICESKIDYYSIKWHKDNQNDPCSFFLYINYCFDATCHTSI